MPSDEGSMGARVKRPALLEICEWVLTAVVAVGCLSSLRNIWGWVWVRYQLNFEEGIILSGVQRVMEGQALYPASRDFPLIIHQYGPLYYEVGAWLLKWLGMGFAPLRLLTLVSAVAVGGLLALLLQHLTGSWKIGFSFGFLFLTLPVTQAWLALVRVDMPGIALTLAGLYLYCRFRDRWYLSIPFFLAAIFCKYTLVAAPGACILDLLFQKRVKAAAGMAGSLALLGGLVFLEVQRTTGGAFAFDTLASHADAFQGAFTFERMLTLVQLAVQEYPLLFVLGFGLALRDLKNRVPTFPSLYLALSTLTLVSAGKFGSDTNHLLEWMAVLCLCGGLGYAALRQQAAEATALLLVPAVFAIFVLVTLRRPFDYPGHAQCAEAYDFVKQHPGRQVLSEDVGAVVMAGKPVWLSDPFVWTWLVRGRGWSDAELQRLIRAHAFDLIILDGPIDWQKQVGPISRWPLGVLDAIEQNYRPTREFACQDAGIAFEPQAGAAP